MTVLCNTPKQQIIHIQFIYRFLFTVIFSIVNIACIRRENTRNRPDLYNNIYTIYTSQ